MPVEIFGMTLFAASMIGTPGPANMVVMASGARFGFRASMPFLGGVILGKQLIIWPIGLGVLTILSSDSLAFQALRWLSVLYIVWLAWRIAGTRISVQDPQDTAPPFVAGLIVHPLNPKAWALIVGALTNFTVAGATPLAATTAAAITFLVLQIGLQSMWTMAGVGIARLIGGTSSEVWLMRILAALMLGSVFYVLLKGA